MRGVYQGNEALTRRLGEVFLVQRQKITYCDESTTGSWLRGKVLGCIPQALGISGAEPKVTLLVSDLVQ